jgi:hypothetical protein
MAIYIAIRKIDENANTVDYTFGLSEGADGRLRLDKVSGQVSLLQAAPGDHQNRFYGRAAHKVRKHWEDGEIPDKTCWAS